MGACTFTQAAGHDPARRVEQALLRDAGAELVLRDGRRHDRLAGRLGGDRWRDGRAGAARRHAGGYVWSTTARTAR
jgi:hypothetical protein